jgi:acetolactate synthase-1/2/3 large subunit
MNGAELLIQILKDKGVNRVFGYPGGAIMPVYDALYESGIEHVLSRHEQGSGFAALGYAKISGKPSVCIATSGPGATNLITAVGDANFDSVPMVVITGQVSTEVMGTDAFQEIDMLGLSLAITKHSFLVEKPEQLESIIHQAFEIAQSGRPGPVLIDFPKNIQLAAVEKLCVDADESTAHLDKPVTKQVYETNVCNKSVAEAITLLLASKQPVFYVGGGVLNAKAETELNQLLEILQAPSVATLKGLGAINLDNELYLGMLGMHGNAAANYSVQECDLLIAVGARFDDRVTGKLDGFATNAKVIHFDIDVAEINKLRKAEVALAGDLKPYLLAISEGLSTLNTALYLTWNSRVLDMKEKHAWAYDKPGESIFAPRLLKDLSDKLQAPSIVTTDVGQHQMWAAQHMRFSKQARFMTSGGSGTMGFGLPVAIGAQFAEPDSTVVVVSGDGSFMMNVQELATIKRYSLPIKIVLIDNTKLGMVKQWQELFFEERYSETDLSDNPDFVVLAKAFDIPGETITKNSQIAKAFSNMLNCKGAFLLHVRIEVKDNVWPLVPPGATNEQMMEKIYDEFI